MNPLPRLPEEALERLRMQQDRFSRSREDSQGNALSRRLLDGRTNSYDSACGCLLWRLPLCTRGQLPCECCSVLTVCPWACERAQLPTVASRTTSTTTTDPASLPLAVSVTDGSL